MTTMSEGSRGLKRFSVVGFFSAVYATLFLAGAVALFVVWTDGFRNLPNLPLAVLVLVPMVASVAAWSYFVKGRRKDGWITAGLFAAAGIPMVLSGIWEMLFPPARHEMVTLEVSNISFGIVCLFALLLSGLLIRELRR